MSELKGPLRVVCIFVSLMIGVLGVRFIVDPVGLMAEAGLPYPSLRLGKLDAYTSMCGIRNIAFGYAGAWMALARQKKAFGIFATTGPFISQADNLVVYKYGQIPPSLLVISAVVTTTFSTLAYLCLTDSDPIPAAPQKKIKSK